MWLGNSLHRCEVEHIYVNKHQFPLKFKVAFSGKVVWSLKTLFSASIRLILGKFGDCWKYTESKRVSQIFYFFLLSWYLASISASFSISDTLKVSVNLPPAIPQDKSDAFVLGDNFVIQMSIPT